MVDADSLKSKKIYLARQMCSLKLEFDTSFEKLLDKLNSVSGETLIKALGDNPKRGDQDLLNSYWLELQLEVAQKIAKLTDFQNELNDRCHRIVMKRDYAHLCSPSTSQEPPGNLPLPETIGMLRIRPSYRRTARTHSIP